VKIRSRAHILAETRRRSARRRVNATDQARYVSSLAAGRPDGDVAPVPREEARDERVAREDPTSRRAGDR
jgi:hypothetical protein